MQIKDLVSTFPEDLFLIASQLNDQEPSYCCVFTICDDEINNLDLQVEVWVDVYALRSRVGENVSERFKCGYCKCEGQWGLAYLKDDGMPESIHEASRPIQIACIDALPAILQKLKAGAELALQELRKRFSDEEDLQTES